MRHAMRYTLAFFAVFVGVLSFFVPSAQAKPDKTLHALYQPAGNAIFGNPQGNLTVVEFFDYNCGYCRLMAPKLATLSQSDPALRIIFREYPILGPRSFLPAQAALAAQKQGKYTLLHDAMLQAKMPLDQNEILKLAETVHIDTRRLLVDMKSKEVQVNLQSNLKLGQLLNIQGVPTFIVARTTPPSKRQPLAAVGPSIDQLKNMIQTAKDNP